jgi:hypothetical protein
VGRVVFIGSESALAVSKDLIDYPMAKTAQPAISRGSAEIAIGTSVTVNSVLLARPISRFCPIG